MHTDSTAWSLTCMVEITEIKSINSVISQIVGVRASENHVSMGSKCFTEHRFLHGLLFGACEIFSIAGTNYLSIHASIFK